MPAAGRLHLPHGSIARNLAVVGGGTALGQGSIVLAAPVLARLYDPQAFGLLSIYTAVISVLLAVASFRFDLAIPTADDAGEAVHLLGLSVILGIVSSAVVGLVVLVWGDNLAAALGAAEFRRFLWLLPVGLLIASVAQALSSWAVYQRAFSALGRMRAIQGVGQGVVQAALGLLRVGPVGLLLGDAAGRAFGTEQLFRVLLGTLRSTELSARTMVRHARARWSFARVMTAASLLNMLSLQVPFLLIPALFDLASSGQYFLAYRMLVLPAALVAAAVNQVFFGEASARRADPGRLHDLTHQVAVSLLGVLDPDLRDRGRRRAVDGRDRVRSAVGDGRPVRPAHGPVAHPVDGGQPDQRAPAGRSARAREPVLHRRRARVARRVPADRRAGPFADDRHRRPRRRVGPGRAGRAVALPAGRRRQPRRAGAPAGTDR